MYKECALIGEKEFILRKFKREILRLERSGVKTFFTPAVSEYEIKAANAVIDLKSKKNINLILVCPSREFVSESQSEISKRAFSTVYFSDRQFESSLNDCREFLKQRCELIL